MNSTNAIIKSLLDLDFYKLTMAQVAFESYSEVVVKYAFKNRTKSVRLADCIPEKELRKALDRVRKLTITPEEINYLRELGTFSEKFLEFLRTLRLPRFYLEKDGGQYKIEVSGKWPETILWETLILSVANELYYYYLLKKEGGVLNDIHEKGRRRMEEKIRILRLNPDIKFIDFGTRRRFSGTWQERVVETLKKEIPDQILGTSNIFLARKFGIKPIGTFAHEMYMIFSGIYHGSEKEIVASHSKVLEVWWEKYGEELSVALTDTYGTDFFFKDFTQKQAMKWRGLRHDSGDPIEFGEKAIAFYENYGIDPKTKLLVFSDGLDLETILMIQRQFHGRVRLLFGWGTNLTNDMGFPALSLVVKAVEAQGHSLVKLSDNLAKAIGDPEIVELFKKLFGHSVSLDKPCKY